MNRMHREWTAVAAGLAGVGLVVAAWWWPVRAAAAEEPKAARKVELWKPEDFIYNEAATAFQISPDGRWLVWVKSVGDKEKDLPVSNLMLSSLTENREIQLTRGSDTNSQPVWSRDGEWIAFLSNRARPGSKPEAAKVQLWLISPRGGEAWPVSELAR